MRSPSESATLLWFRQDLRLRDNAALAAAFDRGGPILPVYVLDEAAEGNWPIGAASRCWLHHSLEALDRALRDRGSRLILARGDAREIVPALARQAGATAVFANRRYEPVARARAAEMADVFQRSGVVFRELDGALLQDPTTLRNKQGQPFQVFTPFWRHCLSLPVASPVKVPTGPLPAPPRWPDSLALAGFELLPAVRWDHGFHEFGTAGEAAAWNQARQFGGAGLTAYANERDRPDHDGTSRLSAHLHFGEITPRQLWAAVVAQSKSTGVFPPSRGASVFLNEIGWREFAYHLLVHFPHTPEQPLRPVFAQFPWAKDPTGARLEAWQKGKTGYPIVDAGMRQLWHMGWMHNRVRMIVASFLVKHLRLPWLEGARWFWDTLVDADLANNTLGWQWSAGCGADAAPYFRIFAPVTQGERFDPDGAYVRRWVPELRRVPTQFIHSPWLAPEAVLREAGVELGTSYPHPIVDHAAARNEALAAFKSLPRTSSP